MAASLYFIPGEGLRRVHSLVYVLTPQHWIFKTRWQEGLNSTLDCSTSLLICALEEFYKRCKPEAEDLRLPNVKDSSFRTEEKMSLIPTILKEPCKKLFYKCWETFQWLIFIKKIKGLFTVLLFSPKRTITFNRICFLFADNLQTYYQKFSVHVSTMIVLLASLSAEPKIWRFPFVLLNIFIVFNWETAERAFVFDYQDFKSPQFSFHCVMLYASVSVF